MFYSQCLVFGTFLTLKFYPLVAAYRLLVAEYAECGRRGATEFPRYSTYIDLLSLLKLIKELNPSRIILIRRWKVIINNVSGVTSKFATQYTNQVSTADWLID